MKTKLTLLCIASVLTTSLTADTIELKSGVTYQGKVLSEDEKSYLVEISYSSSIKDERRIPKDQVRKITGTAKDAEDFKQIKTYTPTPDMLPKKTYTSRVRATSKFLKKYPKSKHTKEVKAILAELTKERKIISEGGIKLNGQLISANEIKTNTYDIDAQIIAAGAKKRAKSGNYQMALRAWEQLEKDYAHSEAYNDSLNWIPRVLKSYQRELQKNLDTFQTRVDKRKAMIQTLEPSDQARTQRLIDEKAQSFNSIMEKEKRDLKTKWVTADPFNKPALTYNLQNAKSALQRIESRRSSKKKLAGPAYQGTWAALEANDFKQAQKHIRSLKSMRVPTKYLTELNSELEKQQADFEAAEKAKAAKEKAAENTEETESDEKKDEEKPSES